MISSVKTWFKHTGLDPQGLILTCNGPKTHDPQLKSNPPPLITELGLSSPHPAKPNSARSSFFNLQLEKLNPSHCSSHYSHLLIQCNGKLIRRGKAGKTFPAISCPIRAVRSPKNRIKTRQKRAKKCNLIKRNRGGTGSSAIENTFVRISASSRRNNNHFPILVLLEAETPNVLGLPSPFLLQQNAIRCR